MIHNGIVVGFMALLLAHIIDGFGFHFSPAVTVMVVSIITLCTTTLLGSERQPNKRMKLTRLYRFKGIHLICVPRGILGTSGIQDPG